MTSAGPAPRRHGGGHRDVARRRGRPRARTPVTSGRSPLGERERLAASALVAFRGAVGAHLALVGLVCGWRGLLGARRGARIGSLARLGYDLAAPGAARCQHPREPRQRVPWGARDRRQTGEKPIWSAICNKPSGSLRQGASRASCRSKCPTASYSPCDTRQPASVPRGRTGIPGRLREGSRRLREASGRLARGTKPLATVSRRRADIPGHLREEPRGLRETSGRLAYDPRPLATTAGRQREGPG